MQRAALERGLIVELGGRGDAVVRLLPPLNVTRRTLDQALEILDDALAVASGSTQRPGGLGPVVGSDPALWGSGRRSLRRAEAPPDALDRDLDGPGVEPDVGLLGRLVRGADSRQPESSPRCSPRVEALRVAGLADLDWGVDEHLQKRQPRLTVEFARAPAVHRVAG